MHTTGTAGGYDLNLAAGASPRPTKYPLRTQSKAVVDVFEGQSFLTPSYRMDRGSGSHQIGMEDDLSCTGWSNQRIVPELNDKVVLEHINKVQRSNQIAPSLKLEGHYNLTIEMETGVGKTYTCIKTMYALNKHYGWSKSTVFRYPQI